MKRFISILACAAAAIVLMLSTACAKDEPSAKAKSKTLPAASPVAGVVERGTVRQIRMPDSPPYPLPAGKGRDTVVVQCAVCHTLAYIPMQPPFSRETWTAEVTKMQKVYSAPIPDNKFAEIVDYLVEVRGAAKK